MAVDDAAIKRLVVMALQSSPGASRVAPTADERPWASALTPSGLAHEG